MLIMLQSIYKNGNPSHLPNHRLIALANIIYKTLHSSCLVRPLVFVLRGISLRRKEIEYFRGGNFRDRHGVLARLHVAWEAYCDHSSEEKTWRL